MENISSIFNITKENNLKGVVTWHNSIDYRYATDLFSIPSFYAAPAVNRSCFHLPRKPGSDLKSLPTSYLIPPHHFHSHVLSVKDISVLYLSNNSS